MLYAEAKRCGPHEGTFLETARDVLDSVAPVIDRWPKYAWVAKQLLEAERVSGGRECWRARLWARQRVDGWILFFFLLRGLSCLVSVV